MKSALFKLIAIISAILALTAFFPAIATRTKELRKAAKEFKRKSRELQEIDSITQLEKELRRQRMFYDDISTHRSNSIIREIEEDLDLDDTRRCLPVVSNFMKFAASLLNAILKR
jgi:septal ring factor EnvC (AmiA/AmiB activator)